MLFASWLDELPTLLHYFQSSAISFRHFFGATPPFRLAMMSHFRCRH
jgi:hypothetical protein